MGRYFLASGCRERGQKGPPWQARESRGATHPRLEGDQGMHGRSRRDGPSRRAKGFLDPTDMLDGALRLLGMSYHRDPVQPPLPGSWYCTVIPTHISRSLPPRLFNAYATGSSIFPAANSCSRLPAAQKHLDDDPPARLARDWCGSTTLRPYSWLEMETRERWDLGAVGS